MNVSEIVMFLFKGSQPLRDWEVRDDGQGSYIAHWNLPSPQPTETELQAVWDSLEFQAWNKERKNTYVDRQTETAINTAIHIGAPAGEQLGILRDQMVQWGNNLGLGFTDDFTRLNEIAIATIKEGAKKKAAL